MLKRGVWIAACVIGVVAAGGLAVLMGYTAFLTVQAGGDLSSRAVFWPIGLLLFAGMCGAALFMSPREVHEMTKPEVDEEPAQWIQDMRRESDTDVER